VHVTHTCFIAVLEEDGFNCEHPYFHCFVAEPSSNNGGDAIVPDNGGELSDTGNEKIIIIVLKWKIKAE
jgi:hypothetical protein